MRSSRHAPDVASLRGSKYSPEGKGIDPTGAAAGVGRIRLSGSVVEEHEWRLPSRSGHMS